MKYSAFDRELLALYLTIKHFRDSHEGRCFAIFIDNKPLCGAITSEVEKSPRQTRHLSFIAEYSTDIRHVSGSSNVVADALSHPAITLDGYDDTPAFFGDSLVGSVSLCPGLDLAALAGAQSAPDAVLEFASLRSSSSLDLRDVPHSPLRRQPRLSPSLGPFGVGPEGFLLFPRDLPRRRQAHSPQDLSPFRLARHAG